MRHRHPFSLRHFLAYWLICRGFGYILVYRRCGRYD